MSTLSDGTTALEVRGGSHVTIASLQHRGHELLVAPDALPEAWRVHGEHAGVTFLHPWANRVTGPPWDALDELPRDPNGVPIHGEPGPWELAAGDDAVRATADRAATHAFPYAHRVEITIALGTGSVVVATQLEATGEDPVPAVFGWHPYFDLPGPTTLAAPARRHLVLGDDQLPTGAAHDEPEETLTLGETTLDEAYDGLADGAAWTAAGRERTVAVRFDHGYGAGQVFAPAGSPSLSIEPMAAPTGALAAGTFPVARPGAPYRAQFTLLLDT